MEKECASWSLGATSYWWPLQASFSNMISAEIKCEYRRIQFGIGCYSKKLHRIPATHQHCHALTSLKNLACIQVPSEVSKSG